MPGPFSKQCAGMGTKPVISGHWVFRGYEVLGVNPLKCPVETIIATWEWGAYLGAEALEQGVEVAVSSWRRMAPDASMAMAKIGANMSILRWW